MPNGTPLRAVSDYWSPLRVDILLGGERQYTITLRDYGVFFLEKDRYPERVLFNEELRTRAWVGNKTAGACGHWLFNHLLNNDDVRNRINLGIYRSNLIQFFSNKENQNEPVCPVCVEKEQAKYKLKTSDIVGFYAASNPDRLSCGDLCPFTAKRNNGETLLLCFDIRPRFGEQMLVHMLGKAYRIINTQELLVRTREDPSGSLLLLALVWLTAFEKAAQNGLPRLYVEREDERPALRGKLLIQQHLKNQLAGRNLHLLPCRFRELTFDNLINRAIRHTFRVVRNVLRSYAPDMLAQVTRADTLLASYGVPLVRVDPQALDHIHYTSMAEPYQPLMIASKALLMGAPETLGGANREGRGFLFSITELWEFYIKAVLEENLTNEGYHFLSANEEPEERKNLLAREDEGRKDKIFELRPDIVVKKSNSIVAVLDAKYRIVHDCRDKIGVDGLREPYGIKRDDIFQLTTYLARYVTLGESRGGALVYPWPLALAFATGDNDQWRWRGDRVWQLPNGTDESARYWLVWTAGFVLPLFFDELWWRQVDNNEPTGYILLPTPEGVKARILVHDSNDLPREFSSLKKERDITTAPPKDKHWPATLPRITFVELIERAEQDFCRRLKAQLGRVHK